MYFSIDNTFPSKHTVYMNRMNTARRASVIRCLIEGCSINSTVRMTGAAKHTVLKLLVELGQACADFMNERMVNLAKTPQYAKQLPGGFLPEAAKFFYDTAQASNAAAMSALKKVVPVSQIVFGTDYPFRTSLEHVGNLKACGVFNAAELRAIERDNPLRLLPGHR